MSGFGQNAGYVDELYRRFLANPGSVSEAWREFFEDYTPPAAEDAPARPAPPPVAKATDAGAIPLTGIKARIVTNMTASLEIPTATSVRRS